MENNIYNIKIQEINSVNGCGVDDTSPKFHEHNHNRGYALNFNEPIVCPDESIESIL